MSRFLAASMCSLLIWVTNLVNRKQFLNETLESALIPITVVSPVTRMYAF